MRKTYKQVEYLKARVVNLFWGKTKASVKSKVYFEEPELQKSFEKFSDSMKELSEADKKKLFKQFQD